MKEGEHMTDQERERLNELDKIIAWNNPTDGGRPLTEEERAEHRELAIKLLQEESPRSVEG